MNSEQAPAGTRVAIGIDLGATKTALAIVSDTGTVLYSETVSTFKDGDGAALAEATAEHAERMVHAARARQFTVAGIGIGSAGVIGREGEVITAANALPGWSGTPLGDIVREKTQLPVQVVNDVRAHALGEAWLGATAHVETSLMVTFGTGVGGCFLTGGKPLGGAHNLAGHVGHFSSPYAAGVACPCGGTGHVEAAASGTAVLRVFEELGGSGAADTRDVARLALEGNEQALEAIERAGKTAGTALGDLANILAPHLIVVASGVINLGNEWWTALLTGYEEAALGEAKKTPITATLLGANAAVLGAASLVL